jgi:hypothetical protein
MKKLHVSELSDRELSAVFTAAAAEAVSRAKSAGHKVPTLKSDAATPGPLAVGYAPDAQSMALRFQRAEKLARLAQEMKVQEAGSRPSFTVKTARAKNRADKRVG